MRAVAADGRTCMREVWAARIIGTGSTTARCSPRCVAGGRAGARDPWLWREHHSLPAHDERQCAAKMVRIDDVELPGEGVADALGNFPQPVSCAAGDGGTTGDR